MSEPKPVYGPIPVRAFGDQRFAGAHFRALGAVACFDRLNGNGRGCFAAYARMADLCGLAVETLKRALADLAEWGYVRLETNPLDARRRVLFVVYSDDDAAAMQGSGRSFTKGARLKLAPTAGRPAGEIGDELVTDSPAVRIVEKPPGVAKVGDELVTELSEIGDLGKRQLIENIERSASNISSLKSLKIYGEAGEGREGDGRGDPPGEPRPVRAVTGEARFWRQADGLVSPAEQAALLRQAAAGVRPSAALLATAASLRARGAA